MTDHKGTREEWTIARAELLTLPTGQAVSQPCHAVAEPGGYGRTPGDTTTGEIGHGRTPEDT